MRWLGLCASILLVGCGYTGDPLPPSLDIPEPIRDLRAFEYGPQIVVEFTLSPQTTEGLPLKSVRAIEVTATGGGQTKTYSLPAPKPGALEHEIPAADWIGQDVELRVRATGPKGRVSDLSNPARVTVIAPLPLPANVQTANVEKGVQISWDATAPGFRIFRATGDAPPQPIGDAKTGTYTDETSIYGTAYRYQVQSYASPTQQGVLTAPIGITPTDTFPPAVPTGLSALAAAASIELNWQPNTDEDFASYNVFRAMGAGAFENVASGVQTPAFSDTKIQAGMRYRYTVSAVDTVGNQSARSMPIEVTP